jgi:pyruvate dehydrogenase E2 component (dihydrolipoamide acetyltransferase)
MAARRAAAADGDRPSYTDLIVAATATALAAVPQVNAVYVDGGLRRHATADIGVAVDTPRGLLVPVLPGVDPGDVGLLHRRLRELVDRTTRGTLRAEDQSPAAVTVSNLGAYGVETGFPLVTEGQTALVFVGALVERPAIVNGGIVVQQQLGLAIAYDHRVVDGATAARFTAALKAALEAAA